MKQTLFCCLIFFYISHAFAQTEAEKFKNQQLQSKYLSEKELKDQFVKRDFSGLFLHTDNSAVYGFIGDNYQRIRVKLITVSKDTLSPDTYHIYGKSIVKATLMNL
jgi:hypothetical protein